MTTQPDTEITLPPDTDLGAMVEAILGASRLPLHPRQTELATRRAAEMRLGPIHDTAQRLVVALERERGVMEEMAGALRLAAEPDCGHYPDACFCVHQIAEIAEDALAKYEPRHVS